MIHSSVTQWQRIIYDPLSWIDPSRITVPGAFMNGLCRAVINEAILNELALVTEDRGKATHGLVRLFIDEWFRLRQVAMLMACQRHRANLASSGLLSTLPFSIKKFIRLPLLSSRFCQGERLLTIEDLQHSALQELLAFGPELPLTIKQRLPLLFPRFYEGTENAISPPLAESGLFILAVQHAKQNPL